MTWYLLSWPWSHNSCDSCHEPGFDLFTVCLLCPDRQHAAQVHHIHPVDLTFQYGRGIFFSWYRASLMHRASPITLKQPILDNSDKSVTSVAKLVFFFIKNKLPVFSPFQPACSVDAPLLHLFYTLFDLRTWSRGQAEHFVSCMQDFIFQLPIDPAFAHVCSLSVTPERENESYLGALAWLCF